MIYLKTLNHHLPLIFYYRNGLARGYAFVYLEKASDVQAVIDYVDGRHLRSRQVRAKTSLGGDALAQVLKQDKKQ